MTTHFEKLGEFRRRFELTTVDDSTPHLLPDADFLFRYDLCQEELHEVLKAHRKGSVVEFTDALIDLLYVVYGLGHEAGVPLDNAFDIVHAANMKKVRATRPEDSKRHSASDVVKPADWIPPEEQIEELLERRTTEIMIKKTHRLPA